MSSQRPRRIVSGGQTGADRAAWDAAIAAGLDYGGWVPQGRVAEDGPLAVRYQNLRETPSSDPAVRTEWNVRDADATLIFSHGGLTGGTALTRRCARRLRKPWLHIDLAALTSDEVEASIAQWLEAERPATLNVAGPRASNDPAIYGAVRTLLERVLRSGNN